MVVWAGNRAAGQECGVREAWAGIRAADLPCGVRGVWAGIRAADHVCQVWAGLRAADLACGVREVWAGAGRHQSSSSGLRMLVLAVLAGVTVVQGGSLLVLHGNTAGHL